MKYWNRTQQHFIEQCHHLAIKWLANGSEWTLYVQAPNTCRCSHMVALPIGKDRKQPGQNTDQPNEQIMPLHSNDS